MEDSDPPIDDGLARTAPAPGEEGNLATMSLATEPGRVMGTVYYMAPEQVRGHPVDARTDIFAFGALLYEMSTGKRPFEGTSQASLIASVLKEEPPAVSVMQPMVPPMLDQAISQCLEKEPDNATALNNLAWILTDDMGQHADALALAEPALKRAPENTDLLDTHGVICMQLERYDEAEASLQKALRVLREDGTLTPRFVGTLYRLGEVYWQAGTEQKAGPCFQKSLAMHEKVGGLSLEQTAIAKQRCRALAIPLGASAAP